MARKTSSGVAGVFKRGQVLYPPTLATAMEIASNTDTASIRGGSPTAFERFIVGSLLRDQSARATLKTAGTSDDKGNFIGRGCVGAQLPARHPKPTPHWSANPSLG